LSAVRLIAAAAAVLVLWTGCTDSNLFEIGHVGLVERQRITAEICAPEPALQEVPYKILFVIDTSLSNQWNDPEGRREAAVRNAINAHIDRESVSFGIITFSDEPRRQTYGFTRDLEVLDGATENVGKAQGGTNYSDTLWETINFILADLATLSPVEAAQTHYLVFWLSDGIPTVGVTDPVALTPSVRYLMDQVTPKVAELTINTAFLGAIPDIPVQQADDARQLLLDMASEGGGAFTDIPAGKSFEFDIDPLPTSLQFHLALAVVTNRNARFGSVEPQPDSDADGLSDLEEVALGLDPTSDDTDRDGFRDGIEAMYPDVLDAQVADKGCETDEQDLDNDGLRDCEELIVGTVPLNPDTDGDFILDSVEVGVGASPVGTDHEADFDLDGLPDRDEVLKHLDPRHPTSFRDMERWGYRYAVSELAQSDPDAPPCYEVRVENVAMVETQADSTHPAGGNVMELSAAFTTDAEHDVRFQRVLLQGRAIKSLDYYDPPHGKFVVAASDFQLLKPDPVPTLVLYTQSFTGEPGDDPVGWTDSNGVWGMSSNDEQFGREYRNDLTTERHGAAFYNTDENPEQWVEYSNYTVSVEARHSTGPDSTFGLIGRAQDPFTYYQLAVRTDQAGMAHAQLWKSSSTDSGVLADFTGSPFEMVSGRRIYLKMTFDIDTIHVTVDDSNDFASPLVSESVVDASPIHRGGVGVRVTEGDLVIFDDLLVTAAPIITE